MIYRLDAICSKWRARAGTKIVILTILLMAAFNVARAQNIDMAKLEGRGKTTANFLLVADKLNKYGKTARLLDAIDLVKVEEFKLLSDFYKMGSLLYVTIRAESDTQDGWVEIRTPVTYRAADFDQAKRIDGPNLSHCQNIENKIHCMYEFKESRNNIPIEAGRIRKILIVNDFLVMTTTLGHLVTCKIEGNFSAPKSNLAWGQVPSMYRDELLSQDLTRIYWNGSRDVYVAGINGVLNGQPFGSKLISFDGQSGKKNAAKTYFKSLVENWPDPTFAERSYYSAGDPIQIELAGLMKGLFSKIPGLDKGETFWVRSRKLAAD